MLTFFTILPFRPNLCHNLPLESSGKLLTVIHSLFTATTKILALDTLVGTRLTQNAGTCNCTSPGDSPLAVEWNYQYESSTCQHAHLSFWIEFRTTQWHAFRRMTQGSSTRVVICPHCNRQSADKLVCTNLGCGKKITAPVQLFARARSVHTMRSSGSSSAGSTDSRRVQ